MDDFSSRFMGMIKKTGVCTSALNDRSAC